MGEVYRARDTRLARDVAIKCLSSRIAADADAVTRFEREARALAALNHPNMAAIYDVIEHEHLPVLVLELVEGATLSDRLAGGPLSIAVALDYARQLTDALDTAHEAGIVHRDLKPSNIKITESGQLKVLDFGLAKAIAVAAGTGAGNDPASTPTITVHGTAHGVILGTAAYMSPEQARGKRIDKRTDIWAFGCVLFEMLTARRAFDGETSSDLIAAIIERQPDLSSLPAATPARVRRVIERCLEKDPRRRARDIADVRVELDTPAAIVRESRRWPPAMRIALAVIALAAIAVAGTAWRSRRTTAAPPAAFEFTFTAPPQFTLSQQDVATISPDGKYIAFIARDERQTGSLWIRAVNNPALRRVDGTGGASTRAVWSPDGRSLAFFVDGVWKRVGVDGGPPITIAANVPNNLGASWGRDDVLLTAPASRTSLARLPIAGGALQPVTELDTSKENSHRFPQLLPDGRHFLFTVRSDSVERLGIKIGSLDSKDVRTLVHVASQGVYTDPGWLLYVTPDRVIMAQRLNTASWTLDSAPQAVAGPIAYSGPSFIGYFDASLDGRVLAYIPASASHASLEWFDDSGKSLGRLGAEQDYRGVRLAADGRRAAVELADQQIGTRDIWIIDATTQAMSRLTSHPATDWRPVFSPDGSMLAFASDRAGVSSIFLTPSNRGGAETSFYRNQTGGAFPRDWSRDGKFMLASVDDPGGRPTKLLVLPSGGGQPTMEVEDPEGFINPRLSPSGERVAFSGRNPAGLGLDLYVMSLRDKQRIRVSTSGGSNPVWGRDDSELYFASPQSELMRATLTGTTMAEAPRSRFRLCESAGREIARPAAENGFDVTADGRVLVVCDPRDATPSAINMMLNWQSKLK